MIKSIIHKPIIFLLLCALLWACFIVLAHGSYPYEGKKIYTKQKPIPVMEVMNTQKNLLALMEELYKSQFQKEKHSEERGHIYTHIGMLYMQMYYGSRVDRIFDSTEHYFIKALNSEPENKHFEGNLNMLYSMRRDFKQDLNNDVEKD